MLFHFDILVLYSCCHPMNPISPAGYHHPPPDPTLPLRFSTRVFSGSSSTINIPPPPQPQPQPPPPPQPLQQHQPYLYTSPSRPAVMSFSSHYPHHQHSVNDYYVGHVLSSGSGGGHPSLNYAAAAAESNYTCIGAPVGHGFGGGSSRGSTDGGGGGRDGSLQNQEEGLNWGRSYSGTQQRLDPPASINRFQDGF